MRAIDRRAFLAKLQLLPLSILSLSSFPSEGNLGLLTGPS